MLMLSTPLIVTPLWPSICKPMNYLSRIAGFYTDISKKIFWGPLSIQLRQLKYFKHNASHYTTVITPKMSDTLTLLYILPCIYYAYVTFFFLFIYFVFAFHFFGKKIVPPPHFSSLSYTIIVV